MDRRAASVGWLCVLVGIGALVAIGLWQTSGADPILWKNERSPSGIMGADCKLIAVVPADQWDITEEALEAAENALRSVERRMSSYRASSEISRLNAAETCVAVPLSDQTLDVLWMSKKITEHTDGAFDVTYSPMFDLWTRCGKARRLPTAAELEQVRKVCGWEQFQLQPGGAWKHAATAAVDLGAIAKGYGVDRAVEAMKGAGVGGGLVNVGGDIRCFGRRWDGKPWRIEIQNPFDMDESEPFGSLLLGDNAVCTSGNYRRFVEIEGQYYSHIKDPRTGRPADSVPSVTVIAPDAATADAWATALSVLGPPGQELIDPNSGVHAMLVIGTADDYAFCTTPGFDAFLEAPATPPPVAAVPAPPATGVGQD